MLSFRTIVFVVCLQAVCCDSTLKIQPLKIEEYLQEGSMAKFICTVTSDKLGTVTFAWLKDGIKLLSDSRTTVNTYKETSTSVLQIADVKDSDTANYTCTANNPDSQSASHIFPLRIIERLKWLEEPKDIATNKGNIITLRCSVKGGPTPTLTWWRKKGDIWDQMPCSDGICKIGRVALEHAGQYKCSVSNGQGEQLQKIISVQVNVPAKFEEKFSSMTVRKGESARLTCEAHGDQPLAINWILQKREFEKAGSNRHEIFETITDHGLSSELLLREVERKDGGVYTCKSENPYGSDEKKIKLSVQDVPSVPMDLRVTEIWSRSVSLVWSEPNNGNSAVAQYHVQYWRNYETARRLEELVVSATHTTALVKGLHPGTPYAASIVAENSVGRSNPSATIHFVTGEEEPSGAPVDVVVKPRGSSTFHVTWQAPPRNEWNGKLIGFYVGFKVRGSIQPHSFKTVEFGSQECLLTNLQRDTEYGIVVKAFNSVGSGPASQEIVVRSLGGDLPLPPTPFVSETAKSSITLRWKPKKTPLPSPNVTGYVIHYKKGNASWQQLPIVPLSQQTATLRELDSATIYYVYMTSSNSFGEGDPSQTLTIRTDLSDKPMVYSAGPTSQLIPVFTDMSLIVPTAACVAAILLVLGVACIWIRRVRHTAPPPPVGHPYMNGTTVSEKGYTFLPPSQRYVDAEKARPLTQMEISGESHYPAPYATIPVRDDTFSRKLSANQRFPQQQSSMKDRPLPQPETTERKSGAHYYDTAQ